MASAPGSLGPVLPSKAEVWNSARLIRHHAARVMEFAGEGPTADLQLALKEMDAIRAIAGAGIEPADEQQTTESQCGPGLAHRLSRNPAAVPALSVSEDRSDG